MFAGMTNIFLRSIHYGTEFSEWYIILTFTCDMRSAPLFSSAPASFCKTNNVRICMGFRFIYLEKFVNTEKYQVIVLSLL
jgi:hypothetical protein